MKEETLKELSEAEAWLKDARLRVKIWDEAVAVAKRKLKHAENGEMP